MKRILLIGLAAFSLTAAAFVIWPMVRVRQLSDAFSGIRNNDAKATVVSAMGTPWKQEDCGVYLGSKPVGCVQELIYAHPYAPYAPEYWVVYFNSNQQVISRLHLISP